MVLDYFLFTVKPLRWINTGGFVPLDRNSVAGKLPEFLHSTENPDIIMMGTSLVLGPAVRCDDAFEGRKTRYDSWYEWNHLHSYNKAVYLRHLLKEKLGTTFSIKNLGHAGGMMADQGLILKNIIAAGKQPKLIICCTSTRDFLDNNHSQIEQTPVFKILGGVQYLPDLLKEKLEPNEAINFVVSNFWHYYKIRIDYRTVISMMATQYTGHPLSLYQSQKRREDASNKRVNPEPEIFVFDIKPNYKPKPNTLHDLKYCRTAYIPPNYSLFEKEARSLDNMLKYAQDHKIALVLVNMPLTNEHKDLLAPGLHQRYLSTLDKLSSQHKIPFYNLDQDGLYTHADFDDSSHLNRSGGEKFYTSLINALTQDQLAMQHFQRKRNLLTNMQLPSI